MKEWFSTQELAGTAGLPGTERAIQIRAKKELWQSRPRSGRGGGNEYHIGSLPAETQRAIRISQAKKAAADVAPAPKADRSALWSRYELASDAEREKAKTRLMALVMVNQLAPHGRKEDAIDAAAAQYSVGKSSIKRWLSDVKNLDQADWLAALISAPKGHRQKEEFTFEAWETFKADYLRLTKPTAAACYSRLERMAAEYDWKIPSYRTVQRHIKEIPIPQRVLLREGEHALMRLYPPQERTVSSLHALEWINGDGYQHNVFVRWPDGEIARPKTWFWQDIYSRKMLAYRVDQTENTDMLRLSFGDVVENYGIPTEVTIDNTRAAANKWMSGGTKTRYRFKVKEDDPMGIFPLLGCNVHWTSVLNGKGHGQSKPVERAFGVGGLGEVVDKHPAFEGAYTGENPTAKPENYGSKAVDLETFLNVLNAEIIAWNAKTKRRTEMAAGIHSFDQVFVKSYERSAIRKATEEQRRLWLLMAESVTVQRDATITLDAGAKVGQGRDGRNRYYAGMLHDYLGEKVTVRFDPQDLHGDVHIYLQNGQYLTSAQCLDAVGFGDTETGREFSRTRKQFMKATKVAAKAQVKLDAMTVAAQMPEPENTPAMEAKIVRPFRDPMQRPEKSTAQDNSENPAHWFDPDKPLPMTPAATTTEPEPKISAAILPGDFSRPRAPEFAAPDAIEDAYRLALDVAARMAINEATEEEMNWYRIFKDSASYRAGKALYGDAIASQR